METVLCWMRLGCYGYVSIKGLLATWFPRRPPFVEEGNERVNKLKRREKGLDL